MLDVESKNIMKTFLPLFLGVFLLSLARADEPSTFKGHGDWSQSIQGVSCRVTPDKTEYTLGEPVRVLVEVRNEIDMPIALGLEPLIEVDKEGRLCRQQAEIGLTFSQGSPGFFATYSITFPKGKGSEARAVVIEPKGTFSEIITTSPWGPTFSSGPSTAQSGIMVLQATLRQFLSPDLKKTAVDLPVVKFFIWQVNAMRR